MDYPKFRSRILRLYIRLERFYKTFEPFEKWILIFAISIYLVAHFLLPNLRYGTEIIKKYTVYVSDGIAILFILLLLIKNYLYKLRDPIRGLLGYIDFKLLIH